MNERGVIGLTRKELDAVIEGLGYEPESVGPIPCSICTVDIYLHPTSKAALDEWAALGYKTSNLCETCAVKKIDERASQGQSTLIGMTKEQAGALVQLANQKVLEA